MDFHGRPECSSRLRKDSGFFERAAAIHTADTVLRQIPRPIE
jgi:hypothetical protein